MADVKENEMEKVATIADGSFIRLIDVNGKSCQIDKNSFIEAVRAALPGATVEQAGLMSTHFVENFFGFAGLPPSDINVVGNHDGFPGGYGWYNNAYSHSDEFAPGGTAGVFFRFNSHFEGARVCFFLVVIGTVPGQMWFRLDGQECKQIER